MDKMYVSVDVEASGPTPGKYSMLSLGACVIGDTSKQFYMELKPINTNFVTSAMRVGCLGLRCLDSLIQKDEYNPLHKKFDPEKVLEILYYKGEAPSKVMEKYSNWINQVTSGFRAVEVASPIKFDGMFTAWYFDNFYGTNPLSFGGVDLNSIYKGFRKDMNVSIFDTVEGITHNALDDAIAQAKAFEKVLEMMKK